MKKNSEQTTLAKRGTIISGYDSILSDIVELLESARQASARTINAIMTATYWEVGRRIVEFEQGGKKRAAYAEALLKRLSADLSAQFGRGFSRQNLQQMRQFYITYPPEKIRQTLSGKLSQGMENIVAPSRTQRLKEL